jgi:hypothetical protein
MRDFDAALGHHLHQIPIRQPIGDVPTHTQLDDVASNARLRYIGSRAIGFVIQHLRKRTAHSTECPVMHQSQRLKIHVSGGAIPSLATKINNFYAQS